MRNLRRGLEWFERPRQRHHGIGAILDFGRVPTPCGDGRAPRRKRHDFTLAHSFVHLVGMARPFNHGVSGADDCPVAVENGGVIGNVEGGEQATRAHRRRSRQWLVR